ncbi:hypothetical protein [Escherichia coli]|uniref:hypothetical protein n=1 Tax=Escherichia coli TaxID=562 RepID=UPI003EB70217
MDLLAESITEVAVSGEIANTDRVLNIAYGIDRNFLFGAAVSMQSVVMHNLTLRLSFISLLTTLMKIIYNVLMLLPAKMLTLK